MPDMPDELDVPDEPNEKYTMNVGVQRKSGDFSTLQTTSNDFKRLQTTSNDSNPLQPVAGIPANIWT
ncbi:MAG: hypothetical protein HON25_12255 [Gammaproteobacteria bacterium]|jgi:hypothetical protein|nr:hypothetical protein [Gammaproteobacteria bacterium]